jgi:cytochrome b561
MSHDVHWRHAIDCVVCVVKLPHVEKFSLLLLPLLLLFLLDDLSYSTHHQQPLFPHLEHAIEVLCYLVIAVFVFCIFLAGCFFPRRTPKKVPSVEFTMVLPQTFQEKVGDFCRHPPWFITHQLFQNQIEYRFEGQWS